MTAFLLPPPCTPGDTLCVVHAAGVADSGRLSAGVERLRARGFTVRHLKPQAGALPYLASDDHVRAAHLEKAIRDPDVKAVVFARGGYGCSRLLSFLPAELLRENPTWLVGYSDVTALHAWAHAQGVASIHGPMAASLGARAPELGAPEPSLDALVSALASAPEIIEGLDGECVFGGRLIGGNLSLVASLYGGRWFPDARGAALVLEEVGEPAYRIDRMLQSLHLRGLDGLRGLVLGQFTNCFGGLSEPDAAARVRELVAPWGVPVVSALSAGHGAANRAICLGRQVSVAAGCLRYDAMDAEPERETAPVTARPPGASLLQHTSLGGATQLLANALRDGVCSAAQLHVTRGDDVVLHLGVGQTAVTEDAARANVTTDTWFDLASLTKALATACLVGVALDGGWIALDDRCPEALCIARPTLIDLLRHSSGLPAYERVFLEARDQPKTNRRDWTERRFAAIDASERGQQAYSDVGYIALGRWLAEVFATRDSRVAATDAPFAAAFDLYVRQPLGQPEIQFGIPTERAHPPDVAATEYCAWRAQTLQGIVHDENAQVLGGACGHAGLFGTAAAVTRVVRGVANAHLFSASTRDLLWDPSNKIDAGTYVLGWDTPSGAASNAGTLMSRPSTVGHLGFTGTSVWFDRAAGVCITLLTNRVHPTRENDGIRRLRPAVHDAVMRSLGHDECHGQPPHITDS
ncbi:MAG: muramoyltetrapeptide carboxypeptidase LdcA involved in peptidoglycan recycling [Bradymonadia bacterium]|jgi:muramoyltetrapeptide carboxypeptidase LdcA involved in peptidoglycan recycling/CubicO group peptidase (beta-lactamase class C family)